MIALVTRLVAELRSVASPRDVDRALDRLRVHRNGETGSVVLGGSDPRSANEPRLADVPEGAVAELRMGLGVYASVPTARARIAVLTQARTVARGEVTLHVAVVDESTHLGRAVVDAPRRLLRAVGVAVAEPGDRFARGEYTHAFFDEEALLGEIASAGLLVTRRCGYAFTLRARDASVARTPSDAASAASDAAPPFALELMRVARLVREVDRLRRTRTPRDAVDAMRCRGRSQPQRKAIGRARLRRAIGWVDVASPGGANCFRRVLLETALDAGAARETLVFGLDVGSTGHVAFEGREERTFDVSFAIPASQGAHELRTRP